ncbi:MAG: hypothetical protein HY716_10750 [Planctomycetes bacterium]|nr:hypothetical protein [Planctomycetota bacterium]
MGRWKEKMDRLGRANQAAREARLKSLTLEQGLRILEGLLAHPVVPPSPSSDHPVSLARRMRSRHA